MKVLLILISLIIIPNVYSQDTIVTKGGKKYPVIITFKDNLMIKYIHFNDPYHELHELQRKYIDKLIIEEAPDGSNLIIYESDSLSNLQLMKACVFLLKEHGFTFNEIDKEFYIIETKMTKIKKSFNVKFSISILNNQAFIRIYGTGDSRSGGFVYNGTGASVASREGANYRGVKKGSRMSYTNFAFLQGEILSKELKARYGGKLIFKSEQ